ncbi:type 1 glutamine amidotransferase domain-containing protein [Alterisphingorhabdus coralli]|uniref:Type 1 glutamine amidotransferase domain-containing protein n=1 Tax=Alterisphingorhabdus coralli TaxID=3071408 RepID=A0AA97I310_9SPHN|nr:type 1 glutamine amidotransferase domain-containing protein [Parasphingorhabdus sp. SCSIO 66989]WOE76280.1 type 1 glutamine amidotransferase domain-containing protein [Parasphingorhabdus sp. SCSIO 66989]
MRKIVIGAGVVAALTGILLITLPSLLNAAGLHPDYQGEEVSLVGKRALIITTSHAILNKPGETDGDPTGVFGSEMTEPYYEFLEGGMQVDIASIAGGEIPIDPSSFYYFIKSKADERYLKDEEFQQKVAQSIPLEQVDVSQYDIIFLAGGWGAAYDFAESSALARLISDAYYAAHQPVLSGVCHGPLGFVKAEDSQGNLLISGRAMTGVTDKQVEQLGIGLTPYHPETELRKAGVEFESRTAFIDIFANHVVIDAEKRFVTGQNQNAGAEVANKAMLIIAGRGD